MNTPIADNVEEDEENMIEVKVQGNDADSKKTFKILKVIFDIINQLISFLERCFEPLPVVTKTKVITPANHKEHRQTTEPIKSQSK